MAYTRTQIPQDLKCDALIVGAGITGSLVAERLTRQGLNVVIIDREVPGRGSTAASTSMLLWEIDRSLSELTETYGFERAVRAYRASLLAVAGLKSLVLQLALPCEMRDKDSLYLAAGTTGRELLEEHLLRKRAGLPGEFLDHAKLCDAFAITRGAAIVSPGAAQADPMQFAHALLGTAVARGAHVFEEEAVEFDASARARLAFS
jgi:glycine/D-amino acid oxidase-like deaminating enzyme